MSKPPPDLTAVYRDHADAMFGFLISLTGSEADTKDLMQDVFCLLATRPQVLMDVQNVRGWLLQVSYRRFIDLTRRRRVHSEGNPENSPIFALTEDPDQSAFGQALESGLQALPADQRVVVFLKLWGEMTFADIAVALEIPMNTAASRYRYGIDKLRMLLRPIYEELK